MNPYIQFQQPQDQQGLMPVFQNIGQQQANQQAALAQQNQQVQQAGQTAQGGGNQLAMAAMLRKKDPNNPNYDQYKTSGDMTYFGSNSNGMGAGGSADFNNMIGL